MKTSFCLLSSIRRSLTIDDEIFMAHLLVSNCNMDAKVPIRYRISFLPLSNTLHHINHITSVFLIFQAWKKISEEKEIGEISVGFFIVKGKLQKNLFQGNPFISSQVYYNTMGFSWNKFFRSFGVALLFGICTWTSATITTIILMRMTTGLLSGGTNGSVTSCHGFKCLF